ncbi:MAG: DUF417 family protein [Bacteroidales bacterium]
MKNIYQLLNEKSALLNRLSKLGYYLAYFGVMLLLLWIGVFKFTPTEAKAIEPLVGNSPFLSWLYSIFTQQQVSNIFGIAEVGTAILMLIALNKRWAAITASLMLLITFCTSLSFLLTTPGLWRVVDGVLITDFFILKDLVLLGFSGMLLSKTTTKA